MVISNENFQPILTNLISFIVLVHILTAPLRMILDSKSIPSLLVLVLRFFLKDFVQFQPIA